MRAASFGIGLMVVAASVSCKEPGTFESDTFQGAAFMQAEAVKAERFLATDANIPDVVDALQTLVEFTASMPPESAWTEHAQDYRFVDTDSGDRLAEFTLRWKTVDSVEGAVVMAAATEGKSVAPRTVCLSSFTPLFDDLRPRLSYPVELQLDCETVTRSGSSYQSRAAAGL